MRRINLRPVQPKAVWDYLPAAPIVEQLSDLSDLR
jgi:hypothetical protein